MPYFRPHPFWLLALAVLFGLRLPLHAAEAAKPYLSPEAQKLVGAKCTGCHRSPQPPAGIDLTGLAFNLSDTHTFGQWVRIHDAIDKGQMPPGGGLPEAERSALRKAIAVPMELHEQERAKSEGRAVLRRLNRYEYENTIRDLFAAPWLQLRDSLPEDGISSRFNKAGQALDVSHVQMARYLETAEEAMRLVLAAAKEPESTRKYYARDQKRMQRRMRYDSFNRHPERASIPILGFEAQPDVLAETAPISVGESDRATRELEGFVTPASTYIGNEYHFDEFTAPVGGRYRLRFNTFSIWIHTVFNQGPSTTRPSWWRPDREKTSRGRTVEPLTIYALRSGREKRLLGSFDVTPEPTVHEITVDLLPGEQILPDASRLFRSRPGFLGSPDATEEGMPGVAYRWMEVTGPVPGEATREKVRTFFGEGKPERLLRSFVKSAYRRPPTEAEIQRYLGILHARLAGKTTPEAKTAALTAAYTAVLCSPGFLYLEEEPGPLSPRALASRLSYFLWNAPPDQELRAAAADGSLARPEVLRRQTDRLLDASRSRDFTNAFLDYWLDLRKLSETTPDQTLYPEYYLDDLLLESALKETQLFFHHLIERNLPARNIVQSDFTMLNSHLARHYGLPPVKGIEMRKVELPSGSVRGGLLTQASVLKITANGTTTSPVLRGAWIMERIVGEPPPPPPPGTPAVEPDTRGATTIRQQLEKHRAAAACAACHAKIDPPGFALESFDVNGGWRDRYRSTGEGEPVEGIGKNGHSCTFKLGQPVDSSGELWNGKPFHDIVEFKQLLLEDEPKIARNMAGQLIAYATGAPVGFADREELQRIVAEAGKEEYGLRTIIHEIVQSRLFRNK